MKEIVFGIVALVIIVVVAGTGIRVASCYAEILIGKSNACNPKYWEGAQR